MADIQRISVQQAHSKTKANQALLVCAYEDEAKCRMLNLEGSIPVLRQNSMRPKIARFPVATGGPIQVIPSPSSAKNLSRGTPRGVPVYIKDGGTRTFSRRYVGAN